MVFRLAWRHLYCVFTYIYLVIEKHFSESWNVSVKIPCVHLVYLRLSSRPSSFSSVRCYYLLFLCYSSISLLKFLKYFYFLPIVAIPHQCSTFTHPDLLGKWYEPLSFLLQRFCTFLDQIFVLGSCSQIPLIFVAPIKGSCFTDLLYNRYFYWYFYCFKILISKCLWSRREEEKWFD